MEPGELWDGAGRRSLWEPRQLAKNQLLVC